MLPRPLLRCYSSSFISRDAEMLGRWDAGSSYHAGLGWASRGQDWDVYTLQISRMVTGLLLRTY